MLARANDIARLIESKAIEIPDFPVLTFVNVEADGRLSNEVRDYRALRDNGRKLASWLQQAGVGEGDCIVLMMRNRPEYVEAMVAAALLGASFVPLDPRSVGDKLAYMVDHVGPKVIIAEEAAVSALAAVSGQLKCSPALLLVEGSISDSPFSTAPYAKAMHEHAAGLATIEPAPSSPMYLMFTSGTTGNPKAVVRSHASYMKGMKGLRALGVQAGDTLYTGLPLCHTNAHSTLAAGLAMSLPTVISRQFTKSRLWDICRANGCTVFTLLGGMIPEIFAVRESDSDRNNPVRLIIASGMPAALWDKYRTRFGVEITEVYGSTENGGVLINRAGEGPAGSMGKPPPGMTAAILDEEDRPCSPFQSGQLCFRREDAGAEAITYFRNQKASADKTARGWFRSGDIAYVDEQGWFYFQHRDGGGIRRNGDFINAAMVETVIAQAPGVLDVFVYGVALPDNVAGEQTPVAAVVLDDQISVDKVAVWTSTRLQKSEQPQVWQPLDAIPKTVSQKPIERECKSLLQSAGLVEEILA